MKIPVWNGSKSPKEAVKRDVGVTPMSPTFGVAGLGEQRSHTKTYSNIILLSSYIGRNPAPLEQHHFPSTCSPTRIIRVLLGRQTCREAAATGARVHVSRPFLELFCGLNSRGSFWGQFLGSNSWGLNSGGSFGVKFWDSFGALVLGALFGVKFRGLNPWGSILGLFCGQIGG